MAGNIVAVPQKTVMCYELGEGFRPMDICPQRGGMTEVAGVDFTDQRALKLRVVAYWDREYDDPLYLWSPTSR